MPQIVLQDYILYSSIEIPSVVLVPICILTHRPFRDAVGFLSLCLPLGRYQHGRRCLYLASHFRLVCTTSVHTRIC
jgi:hypothetical protein